LPVGIYVRAEDNYQQELWSKLLRNDTTVKKIAAKMKVSLKQMYRWKEGTTCFPLSVFETISAQANIAPRISYLKSGSDSEKLFEPNIDSTLTSEVSELVGHILHDGGIDGDRRVHYTSNDIELLRRFQYLIQTCFGRTKCLYRKSGAATTLYYPTIIGALLIHRYQLRTGNKVQSNTGIPSEFKEKLHGESLIVPYISAAYLCDGENQRTRIAMGSKDVDKPSKLHQDTADLLARLGFKSVIIKSSLIYQTKRGLHRRWVLEIGERNERERFRKMIQDYTSGYIDWNSGAEGKAKSQLDWKFKREIFRGESLA
jgi:hypothetical protein